ncbi:hypothetical protein [Rhodococcus aetherivorans]|uniref:hypothetical protein n=1 Tax=Rhodococcus aetherivorans TaxID=191292 RepID=UPI0038908487
MGRMYKQRKSDGKWRVWSTNTDSWITDWITEDDVKRFIFAGKTYDYEIDVIQRLWCFPNGLYDRDSHRSLSGPINEFHDWYSSVLDDADAYEDKVHAKFVELTEGFGS